jgi:hypothetical protein
VEKVCHADVAEIGRTAKELTTAHFPAGDGVTPVRFAVSYEHRASKDLDRMAVINSVVDQIPQVSWFMVLQDVWCSLYVTPCVCWYVLGVSDLSAACPIITAQGRRLTGVDCGCSRRTRWI